MKSPWTVLAVAGVAACGVDEGDAPAPPHTHAETPVPAVASDLEELAPDWAPPEDPARFRAAPQEGDGAVLCGIEDALTPVVALEWREVAGDAALARLSDGTLHLEVTNLAERPLRLAPRIELDAQGTSRALAVDLTTVAPGEVAVFEVSPRAAGIEPSRLASSGTATATVMAFPVMPDEGTPSDEFRMGAEASDAVHFHGTPDGTLLAYGSQVLHERFAHGDLVGRADVRDLEDAGYGVEAIINLDEEAN